MEFFIAYMSGFLLTVALGCLSVATWLAKSQSFHLLGTWLPPGLQFWEVLLALAIMITGEVWFAWIIDVNGHVGEVHGHMVARIAT